MSKIIKKSLLIMSAFLLAGCMKFNIGIEVKEDLSMIYEVEMIADVEMMKSLDENWDPNDMQEYADASDISSDGGSIETISKEIDGRTWAGVKMTKTMDSNEASEYLKVEKGKIIFTMPSDELGASENNEDDSVDYEMLKGYGFEMNVAITMPRTPTTNVGTIEGNTVLIDLTSKEVATANEIVISCSNNNGTLSTVLIVAAILCAILTCIQINKKKKTTESVEEPIELDENTPYSIESQVDESEITETNE